MNKHFCIVGATLLVITFGLFWPNTVAAYRGSGADYQQRMSPTVGGDRGKERSAVPQAPTDLWLSATSQTSYTIAWTDNSDDEFGFNLYAWDGTNWNFQTTLAPDTTSLTVNASCETGQYYYLTAFNGDGESAPTESVNAHTGPCSDDPGDCPNIQVDTVTFYEHWKCIGSSSSFVIGEYATIGANDSFSSVKIPVNQSVLIFRDVEFSGPSRCLSQSLHDFFYADERYDDGRTSLSDSISSIKVFADNTCGIEVTLSNRTFLPLIVE